MVETGVSKGWMRKDKELDTEILLSDGAVLGASQDRGAGPNWGLVARVNLIWGVAPTLVQQLSKNNWPTRSQVQIIVALLTLRMARVGRIGLRGGIGRLGERAIFAASRAYLIIGVSVGFRSIGRHVVGNTVKM